MADRNVRACREQLHHAAVLPVEWTPHSGDESAAQASFETRYGVVHRKPSHSMQSRAAMLGRPSLAIALRASARGERSSRILRLTGICSWGTRPGCLRSWQ